MRILLIEDEKKIASFITRGLKEMHYAVDVAHTGEDGLFLADVKVMTVGQKATFCANCRYV